MAILNGDGIDRRGPEPWTRRRYSRYADGRAGGREKGRRAKEEGRRTGRPGKEGEGKRGGPNRRRRIGETAGRAPDIQHEGRVFLRPLSFALLPFSNRPFNPAS